MLTDEEIEAIERRAARATRGPWTAPAGIEELRAWRPSAGEVAFAELVRDGGNKRSVPVCATFEAFDAEDADTFADAAFIAHAREDVPRLIGEIRRLKPRG